MEICKKKKLDERNAIDVLTQEEKDLGDFLMGIFLE